VKQTHQTTETTQQNTTLDSINQPAHQDGSQLQYQ
jgi:hypothetical protein